jgi:hypothetical protein
MIKQKHNEDYYDYHQRLLQKSLDILDNDINQYNYDMVKTLLKHIPSEILEDYVNNGTVNEPFYIK